ncbi:MAG: hypothetical protein COZ37_06485 [bacterium (Candidatus Ratteibacteria) CG_4_10_14_3_um_filter_41_18]|uniref:Plasmid pRiA4b Orf3-like domain-containing protein n=2 Tax=Candidatus Ratteibacteria TaxID=2979319 RepID=A0A2M7YG88_9BACT|nr:MAG: hypothetical protein COZ37_06485 [bacterium (Candidatus Ratteibacteria) CG_4_10_14_3_um_filter_41_18]PJA61987.1 MAG: hypothetical protein CO162_03445 [bacterium (Candidatus Ratteibacteria) CG_4_9_14_3_um_filter_41_21]
MNNEKTILPILTISETEPTPLLQDFATFIHYLIGHHIVLTRTNEFISGKELYELNQMMTYPLPDSTSRTEQPSYPLLHLFYYLVLAGKLFQKTSKKGRRLVLEPTGRLQIYEELKPAEKYFFLLETFWVDADWEKLQGTHAHSPIDTVPAVLEYMSKQQAGRKIRLKDERKIPNLIWIFWDWGYFLLYFSFFGFWDVTRDEDTLKQYGVKRYFQAESITPSAFGVRMFLILKEARKLPYWNLPSRRKSGEWKNIPGSPLPDENPFFLPFIPLFPEGELQKSLPREGIKFVDGTYIFKVSLAKDLWRRIEISANHTLLDLHGAIQETYDFDDDHLYSFFMDGKRWSHERFTSPFDDEGPHVDEVRIGELGLFAEQNILYLFDYGDEWKFRVELEDIRLKGPKPRKPKVIGKKGESPEQYPRYDEE